MVDSESRETPGSVSERRWHRVAIAVLLLLFLSIVPSACSVVIDQQVLPGVTTSPATGTNEVPLTIVSGPGGTVLALVPVYLNGQGPFGFALDTGASMTVVDSSVVKQLNLPVLGSAGEATGVGGMVTAQLVRVDSWRVGNVNLPPQTIATVDLPGSNTERGLKGLLGSDILSDYGEISVNYDRRVLTLGPHTSPQPSPP